MGRMRLRIFTEPQQGADYATLRRVAQATERLGFDAFFRSDHYLNMGEGSGLPGPTDAWATLAALAVETSRIRLGTLVSPVTFRLPGPLAVTVAQVDQMSGGRVELGLGAGWFDAEHAAYGIPFPPLADRFGMLSEQLAIITGLWATPEEQTFSFRGEHYQVTDSPALPKPAQRPGPPVVIGGGGRAGRRGWRPATPMSSTWGSAACPTPPPRSAGYARRARRLAATPRRCATRWRRRCAAAGTPPSWSGGRPRSAAARRAARARAGRDARPRSPIGSGSSARSGRRVSTCRSSTWTTSITWS